MKSNLSMWLGFAIIAFVVAYGLIWWSDSRINDPDLVSQHAAVDETQTNPAVRIIKVSDIESERLTKVLADYCSDYDVEERAHFSADGQNASISVPASYSFQQFALLVNYVRYCNKEHIYDVTGWYSVGQNASDDDVMQLSGKTLMLYIPDDDTKYDNIYFVTPDGAFFKQRFLRKPHLELISRDHRPYAPAPAN